jgi:IclR family transcriptional regulator, acetate operon repressor
MKKHKNKVGVLRKTIQILSCFRSRPEGLTLAEISVLSGINKSTAHRLLFQLESEALLQRENHKYRIGQGLFQLGILAPQPLALLKAAYPIMADLAREIGETINLAILDRTEILILHSLESPHEFRMAAKIGSRRPFYVTSLGKAIAAFLSHDKQEILFRNLSVPFEHPTPNSVQDLSGLRNELAVVLARGYSVDNEEAVRGVRAVGAPVFEGSGQVTAAVSVSGPASRISPDHVLGIVSHVVRCADSITTCLGGDPDVSRQGLRGGVSSPKEVETTDSIGNLGANADRSAS